MTTLVERLIEHAVLHEQYLPYSPEQTQWAKDLREAAARIERLEAVLVAMFPAGTTVSIDAALSAQRGGE
jgi:hypothetical protein